MDPERNVEQLGGLLSVDRLKSLTDGVLTVVVTIMVFGIDVPTDHRFSDEGLFSFLRKIGYEVSLYVISFWLVATYWGLHYSIFQYLRYANRTLFWINLLFLLPASLIPFVTKLKGLYRLDPAATILFGGVQIACGLCLLALWQYATSRPHLLVGAIEPRVHRSMIERLLVSPILLSAAAIGMSFVEVHVGTTLFLAIPLFYLSHRVLDGNWNRSGGDAR